MSNEKKSYTVDENEQRRRSGNPFARDDDGAKAEGAAGSEDRHTKAEDDAAREEARAKAAEAEAQAAETGSAAGSPEERVRELEERLKRAVAEQENLRKRMEREKADTARYAIANFAREVLGIADNIQRAIEAVPKDAAAHDTALKTFLDGIEVTERELHKAMERHGIAKLNPEGERFDPNFHQAMFEIPSTEMPSGMVMQVVQPGYLLEDRVLRPAMVGVSKAAPAASGGADKPQDPPTSGGNAPADDEPPAGAAADDVGADTPGDEAGESATKTQSAAAQNRGASRLNEPVINADTQTDHESGSAGRKA